MRRSKGASIIWSCVSERFFFSWFCGWLEREWLLCEEDPHRIRVLSETTSPSWNSSDHAQSWKENAHHIIPSLLEVDHSYHQILDFLQILVEQRLQFSGNTTDLVSIYVVSNTYWLLIVSRTIFISVSCCCHFGKDSSSSMWRLQNAVPVTTRVFVISIQWRRNTTLTLHILHKRRHALGLE